MRLVLNQLEGTIVPQPNKYYTFIYKAKTPRITYDTYPLILCGSIFSWGFNGENIHWNATRQYSFGEVVSNVYELSDEEFAFLRDVPLANFKTT